MYHIPGDTVCRFCILRQEAGISLRELAAAAGLSFQYVNDVERCLIRGSKGARELLTDAMEDILWRNKCAAEQHLQTFRSSRQCLFEPVLTRGEEN